MQGDLNCDNNISSLSSGPSTEVAMEVDSVHRFQQLKSVDWELIE